jgi:hypothetical protein
MKTTDNNVIENVNWIATKINEGWAIKEKSLQKGYSDRIAELYQYDTKANAKLIVKAVNNHYKLIETLKELLRFENLFNHVAPKLQYPDNFLKAVDSAKQLLNEIEKQ